MVNLYQTSLKNTSKRGESHAIEIESSAIAPVEANNIPADEVHFDFAAANTSLDVSNFFEDF